jgi:hypothetical protein
MEIVIFYDKLSNSKTASALVSAWFYLNFIQPIGDFLLNYTNLYTF